MATRRDQLHSYQFMNQRVISAFVMRETDPQQSPLRRGIGAVFGGLMIAILVAAGFGVYGILTKTGSDKWQTDGSVVIEKETGASFVYVDGELHPTLNLASAMLAAGRPHPTVFRVAGNSLDTAPRGITIGIPGAPDSLPTADKHLGPPWTICATPGTDSSGASISTVTFVVATAPAGARAVENGALLVKDAKLGMTFLIWQGHRYLVQESRTVVPALFGAATAVPVGTAWLNALPAGTDIMPVRMSGRGEPSGAVTGRKIGDVLVTQTGSGPQYYLVFDDGLAPITHLQQAILNGEFPAEPARVAVSDVTSVPRSTRLSQPDAASPPSSPPELTPIARGDQLCSVTGDARSTPTIWVGGSDARFDDAIPTRKNSADGSPLADRVLVPAGRVATVRVTGSPSAVSGTYYVITDRGIKYAVPSPAALQMLGYQPDQVVDLPATLAARIPTGPTLDPDAAIKPALVAFDGN